MGGGALSANYEAPSAGSETLSTASETLFEGIPACLVKVVVPYVYGAAAP